MDSFVIYQADLIQKYTLNYWKNDDIEKYLYGKIKYVDSVDRLVEQVRGGRDNMNNSNHENNHHIHHIHHNNSHNKINQDDKNSTTIKLIQSLPHQLVQQLFPSLLHLKQSPNDFNYRINLIGQQRSHKQKQIHQQFVKSIAGFFQKQNSKPLELQEYELNEVKLPVILQELFYYFQQNRQKVKLEGLFRKSVSIDEENQTLVQLMNYNYKILKNVTNPHLIANLIKRFFSKLRTPIIPYKQFYQLMNYEIKPDNNCSLLQLVIKTVSNLKLPNYITLMFLSQFLISIIIPQQKHTKMTTSNIAICFAPSLLHSEQVSELDFKYTPKSIQIVRIILENFQKIFGNKQQREKKLNKIIEDQRNNWEEELNSSIRQLSYKCIDSYQEKNYKNQEEQTNQSKSKLLLD